MPFGKELIDIAVGKTKGAVNINIWIKHRFLLGSLKIF